MSYLDEALKELKDGTSHLRLKRHCQTRWTEQVDALLVFPEMYDAVVRALGTIATECDESTASTAVKLSTLITSFQFLVALCTAAKLLSYRKPMSVLLQKSGLDLCKAMSSIG